MYLDPKEEFKQIFNEGWRQQDGGCLRILRSKDASDCHHEVAPEAGRSVFLVRSDRSWHEVSKVTGGFRRRRRSLQVTFWAPGSESAWGARPYYG